MRKTEYHGFLTNKTVRNCIYPDLGTGTYGYHIIRYCQRSGMKQCQGCGSYRCRESERKDYKQKTHNAKDYARTIRAEIDDGIDYYHSN